MNEQERDLMMDLLEWISNVRNDKMLVLRVQQVWRADELLAQAVKTFGLTPGARIQQEPGESTTT